MKICITSRAETLDSEIETRFGRSPYFIIYDLNSKKFEVIENPYCRLSSGAGLQASQLIADKKVNVILTGHIGPKALEALNIAGIKVIAQVQGTVKEAIDKYLSESISTKKENGKKLIFKQVG